MTDLTQRILKRVSELEDEAVEIFDKSTHKDTHILMRHHYRNTFNELVRAKIELEKLIDEDI